MGPIISRCRKDADPNPGHRFDGLKRIGIDETSYKKGHKYITVIVNHDTNSVIWMHEKHGKVRAESWQNARKKEEERGRGSPKKRRRKRQGSKTIKGSMYDLGKAPENLTEWQKAKLDYIANTARRLYRAYCLKESLRTLIKLSPDEIAGNLKGWLWKAFH